MGRAVKWELEAGPGGPRMVHEGEKTFKAFFMICCC